MRQFFIFWLLFLITASCTRSREIEEERELMIQQQLVGRGIVDKGILRAFRVVPREEFVLPEYRKRAYDDIEAPLGEGQTLDRPYEDALILKALALKPHEKVFEVGTGAGYLAALMAQLAHEVYTIEIRESLANAAAARLKRLGFHHVFVKAGDGYVGWPAQAPFDAMVLTASPDHIPKPLTEQLREGGRMVLPLGGEKRFQELQLYRKKGGRLLLEQRLMGTTFVPMEGKIKTLDHKGDKHQEEKKR